MPDAWELEYFGNTTNAVPGLDSDGDGPDNEAEYISGFNPTNPASYFSITGFELQNGSSNLVLHWTAVQGRSYDAQWANSLNGPFSTIISNMPYPQNTCTVTVHQAQSEGLYRIGVQLTPTP